MEFEPTEIPDVIVVHPRVFGDARGFFFESWEERKFAAAARLAVRDVTTTREFVTSRAQEHGPLCRIRLRCGDAPDEHAPVPFVFRLLLSVFPILSDFQNEFAAHG